MQPKLPKQTAQANPRMRNFKKWLAAITVVIAYVATGIPYARYSPQRSDTYLWGVYHVHSNMSDGLQSPEEIAVQARASGVRLVLLTDHGNPNQASSRFRETIDGVTVVGGSEASLPDGHFTFFGARETPGFRLSSFPPEAMDDAREWGAFPVLAYPQDPLYGWRYWNADLRPGGIEVLNLFTSLRGGSWADRLRLAMYYPFSHYYFLKTIVVPPESLARWDGFLQRQKIWGFLASDAHGGFHIGPWISIKVPSYANTFSLAGMGISRRYESDPEAAIRSGDFFNCIRGAGEPDRFEFTARYGSQEFPSGGDAPANSSLQVEVETGNQSVRLVLKKDGAPIREIVADRLDFKRAGAGVYRVEAFLIGHPLLRADVPWILSNPIFVGTFRPSTPARASSAIRAQLAKRGDAARDRTSD
jgi:PHP domain